MPDSRASFGRRGEDLAAAFLLNKGCRIIGRNWRCRFGEIDLIVQRRQETRFIEVKTRATRTYGYPEEAVTATKRLHLAKSVHCWLGRHPEVVDYSLDVVAISLDISHKIDIQWIEAISP